MALTAGAGRCELGLPDFPRTTDGTSLAARVLVLDDGAVRLALVSLSVIALVKAHADVVRQAVAETVEVPVEHVLCACTHVHSGPATLAACCPVEHLSKAAATAARQALPLHPGRCGYAVDNLYGVSRVRRIVRQDGSVITLRRAWPQWWNWASDPQTAGPEEPLDDLLTVMRVDNARGEPVAAVMHFTCHPIPDYFGYAADLVERVHPDVPCLVLNGCSGSVDTPFEVPMRGMTQAGQLPILGDILGYRTLELLTRAETSGETSVGACSRGVFLPAKQAFLDAPAEKATVWPQALRDGGFHTEVQCLRVGDLALAGIPGEAQIGFAQQVEEVSPFALTRPVGLANDEVGYLFSAESRARGGYEPDPQYWGVVDDGGLPIILQATRECLAQLAGGGR